MGCIRLRKSHGAAGDATSPWCPSHSSVGMRAAGPGPVDQQTAGSLLRSVKTGTITLPGVASCARPRRWPIQRGAERDPRVGARLGAEAGRPLRDDRDPAADDSLSLVASGVAYPRIPAVLRAHRPRPGPGPAARAIARSLVVHHRHRGDFVTSSQLGRMDHSSRRRGDPIPEGHQSRLLDSGTLVARRVRKATELRRSSPGYRRSVTSPAPRGPAGSAKGTSHGPAHP
jgi:hypothetical protein